VIKTALISALERFALAGVRDVLTVRPDLADLQKGDDVNVFTLLLRHGASPDVPGQDSRTVRQIASRKRDKRYFAALARTERRQVAR
jgi:hypothetical protein